MSSKWFFWTRHHSLCIERIAQGPIWVISNVLVCLVVRSSRCFNNLSVSSCGLRDIFPNWIRHEIWQWRARLESLIIHSKWLHNEAKEWIECPENVFASALLDWSGFWRSWRTRNVRGRVWHSLIGVGKLMIPLFWWGPRFLPISRKQNSSLELSNFSSI